MGCICTDGNWEMQIDLAPLEQILAGYAREERWLIPILQDAQDVYGYLPFEVLQAIARHVQVSFSKVYGVVTFYTQFHLKPRGRNVIKVCTGTACHVRGGGEVLAALEEALRIKAGETTPDLEFTLETVACLGACGLAPVIMVNEDTHGRVNPDSIKAILDSYRKTAPREVAAV